MSEHSFYNPNLASDLSRLGFNQLNLAEDRGIYSKVRGKVEVQSFSVLFKSATLYWKRDEFGRAYCDAVINDPFDGSESLAVYFKEYYKNGKGLIENQFYRCYCIISTSTIYRDSKIELKDLPKDEKKYYLTPIPGISFDYNKIIPDKDFIKKGLNPEFDDFSIKPPFTAEVFLKLGYRLWIEDMFGQSGKYIKEEDNRSKSRHIHPFRGSSNWNPHTCDDHYMGWLHEKLFSLLFPDIRFNIWFEKDTDTNQMQRMGSCNRNRSNGWAVNYNYYLVIETNEYYMSLQCVLTNTIIYVRYRNRFKKIDIGTLLLGKIAFLYKQELIKNRFLLDYQYPRHYLYNFFYGAYYIHYDSENSCYIDDQVISHPFYQKDFGSLVCRFHFIRVLLKRNV